MPHAPLIVVARARRNDDYLESTRRAGGHPLLAAAPGDLASGGWIRVAGVLLTGGPDVDPRLYGEEPHVTWEPAAEGRDAFEIELVTRAIERDLPILAICRGAQVLNVALGGTLVQDIPAAIPRALEHRVRPPTAMAHEVSVAPESLLARVLAGQVAAPGRVSVNSRHHQAVKHPAAGLVVSATSDDGVIEAVERPASRYCLGVQWHPENFWRTGEFDRLFQSFVDACRG
jgi:putative glutamine amidotransferase